MKLAFNLINKYINKMDRKKKQKYNQKVIKRNRSPQIVNNKIPDKFELLYQNYGTNKTRVELKRQKILEEKEKNEMAECSFNPKINSSSSFKKKIYNKNLKQNGNNENGKKEKCQKLEQRCENFYYRQTKWLEEKNKKIDNKKVEEAFKNVEGCVFEPEINKQTANNYKTESLKLVEDPFSYLNFIERLKKGREENQRKKSTQLRNQKIKTTRSPPVNFRLKKKYNNYDYTKHELSENCFMIQSSSKPKYNLVKNRSNENFNRSNNATNSSHNHTSRGEKNAGNKKSIPFSKMKITNLSNDELYNMIYMSEKDKFEKEAKDYTEENANIVFGGKKQITFKQALENLHNILINMDFNDKDDDDNDNA